MHNKEFFWRKYREANTEKGLPNLIFFGIKASLILDRQDSFPSQRLLEKEIHSRAETEL